MSKIPEQKHSKRELSNLRAQSAMQTANSSMAETYNKKIAHKGVVVLGYILPLVAPVWLIVKKVANNTFYSIDDFYIMSIPIVLALILALWISLTRVLSRHNSAFICIISLLCCFAIVSAVNSDKNLKYELFSLIGKESPMPDPLLETDEESVNRSADVLTDEEREELRKWDERARKAKVERDAGITPSPSSVSP